MKDGNPDLSKHKSPERVDEARAHEVIAFSFSAMSEKVLFTSNFQICSVRITRAWQAGIRLKFPVFLGNSVGQ